MDWSLRGCSRSGHVTYAPAEPSLRDRLHVDTPAGEAWRCLRCATFVVGPPAGTGPAEDAPLVLRGKALKDATILRLLAAERVLRGLLLLALAYGVVYFENAKTSIKDTFDKAIPAARPRIPAPRPRMRPSPQRPRSPRCRRPPEPGWPTPCSVAKASPSDAFTYIGSGFTAFPAAAISSV